MRGMKVQGIPRETLPYIAVSCPGVDKFRADDQPFQPYLTYVSLFFVSALTFFKGFDAFMPFDYKLFITSYIGIPVYVFGYTGYKRELGRFCLADW